MGYNTIVVYPFDRWLHIKLLIKAKQAELYIDNKPEPVAFIRELLMDQKTGGLGLKATVGATWFANFLYTKTSNINFFTKINDDAVVTPVGTIRSWQVSETFKEP